ncbi:ribonuclease HII [Flavobacterium sp. NKUCC04_CG]|uniref:ribonuclease HII n=1 Tax=Flavobacterium sp. NKUCC04_CG TaxID=2842121 RepID=UPI001C5AD523|nr:ribonuclease HII [Flavobacterium sp. NKUCC04_CG]MBW3517726.1 ribonuclease HII [Flavobacterium sp. NKUCC04_CG]
MLLSNFSGKLIEAGTDEAGRGCIAGPVTAAAVILPFDFQHEILNDSKKITEKTRYSLRELIEREALSFKVTHLDESVVDEINILNASIKAMQLSLQKLDLTPEYIIVDGNRFYPIDEIPFQCIVKGDMKYLSIAAASILAKTYRDDYMNLIHEEFPMYNWKKNKGYPTKEHRDAIRAFGPCKYHRTTFRLLPEQLSLEI